MYHGGLMQRYWAYSCRAHFAGAIAGQPSAILSPVGEIIASSTSYRPYVVATVNLDCAVAHLDVNGSRGRLTALKAKYGPKVTVFAPDHLGSVLITCEAEECTVHDMVREFEIEMLDDYFARSREVQREKRRPAGRVPCA